ncbi:MAG: carbohydrate-binding domain-containing protein, partial [Lachnospirales bacterium]
GNDGFQSDNTDEGLGYVTIINGDFTINAANDGIQAESLLQIDNGNFNIITNEGSANAPAQTGNNNFGGGGMGAGGFGGGDRTFDITSMPNYDITTVRETLSALDSDTLTSLGISDLEALSDTELETLLTSLDDTQNQILMKNVFGGNMRGGMSGGEAPTEGMTPPTGEMPTGTGEAPTEGMTPPTGEMPTQTETTTDTTTTESYKALKGYEVIINGGTFNLDSYDDAVNSDTVLTINGGDLTVATGDDGIKAEDSIIINGGNVNIVSSYEGVEATIVTFNDGTINITASDDGVNATSSTTSSPYIYVNGGYITVDSNGDGVDSNAIFEMNGGELYISGASQGADTALDTDRGATVNGGLIMAIGASGMIQNISDTSEQNAITYYFTESQSGTNALQIIDKNGDVIIEYTPVKDYSSLVLSSPLLVAGETYTISNGNTTEEITLSSDSNVSVFGTSSESSGMGGMRGQGNRTMPSDQSTTTTTTP